MSYRWVMRYSSRSPRIDEQGRLNLSRRDALIEVEGLTPESTVSDSPRPPRREGGFRREGGNRPPRR